MGIVCGKFTQLRARISGWRAVLGANIEVRSGYSTLDLNGLQLRFRFLEDGLQQKESCWRVIGFDSMPQMVHPGRTTGSKTAMWKCAFRTWKKSPKMAAGGSSLLSRSPCT
jgi:hypothetical protein